MILKYANTDTMRPCGWTLCGGFESIKHDPVTLWERSPWPKADVHNLPDMPFSNSGSRNQEPLPEGSAHSNDEPHIKANLVEAQRSDGAVTRFLISTEAYITNNQGDTLEALNRTH